MAKIQLQRVLRLCDPRSRWPWRSKAPSARLTEALLADASEIAKPIPSDAGARAHLGRVRHLARVGWADPIELDVGVPALGYAGPAWPVTDGNHRLWAACLRGDEFIEVNVSGQIDHAALLLGVSEHEVVNEPLEQAA